MVALKGKSDIGDKINTQIIQPLIDANSRLGPQRLPRFQRPEQARRGGQGGEAGQPDRHLQKPALDFSKNRAENDDILGDAYEYLMRHFATESGKSKGQFYTPPKSAASWPRSSASRRQTPRPPPPPTTHLRLGLAAAEGAAKGANTSRWKGRRRT
jgi:hypothetical protein